MVKNPGSHFTLTVSAITEIAPGFKIFTFSDGHGIQYQPGQFLTFVERTGVNETRRSYSILSIPFLGEPLSIGVKRIENGYFSRKLIDRVRVGDQLATTGASGMFRLPEDAVILQYVVLFAAGSGITPIYSLLCAALYQHPHLNVVLFYSNRSRNTTALYDALVSLAELYGDRLTIHFLFSSSKELSQARLTRDRLIEFLNGHRKDIAYTYFFACGPESYMMKILFVLHEHGVPSAHIRREEFVIRKITAPPLPPDTQSHQVVLKTASKEYRFKVDYPDSILQAAKKLGIPMEYSCKSGKCGSCVIHCLQGKVWLSNNEVLTDDDLRKGLTLTCVGHPVGGDVTISFQP